MENVINKVVDIRPVVNCEDHIANLLWDEIYDHSDFSFLGGALNIITNVIEYAITNCIESEIRIPIDNWNRITHL